MEKNNLELCACVFMCVRVCTCVCQHVCEHICACMCEHMHVDVFSCVVLSIYVCSCVHVCEYMCMHMCACMCVCASMYVCACTNSQRKVMSVLFCHSPLYSLPKCLTRLESRPQPASLRGPPDSPRTPKTGITGLYHCN